MQYLSQLSEEAPGQNHCISRHARARGRGRTMGTRVPKGGPLTYCQYRIWRLCQNGIEAGKWPWLKGAYSVGNIMGRAGRMVLGFRKLAKEEDSFSTDWDLFEKKPRPFTANLPTSPFLVRAIGNELTLNVRINPSNKKKKMVSREKISYSRIKSS